MTAPLIQAWIGAMPRPEDLNTQGLNIEAEALRELTSADPGLWRKELEELRSYFEQYGERLPEALKQELEKSERQLKA